MFSISANADFQLQWGKIGWSVVNPFFVNVEDGDLQGVQYLEDYSGLGPEHVEIGRQPSMNRIREGCRLDQLLPGCSGECRRERA